MEVGEGENDALPRLGVLILSKPPKLKIICDRAMNWPLFEWLDICEYPKLKKLSFISGSIVAEREWWEALEWEDQNIANSLPQPRFDRRR
ncbi:hypothetical protein AMTRI_Chr09g32610 [Amborella trichopoda]